MGFTTRNQITLRNVAEGSENFVDFNSQRKPPEYAESFNNMPVGYDACPSDEFVEGYGGNTDVSGGVTASTLEAGFKKKSMPYGAEAAMDDMDEGKMAEATGFATPRNNYYDRM